MVRRGNGPFTVAQTGNANDLDKYRTESVRPNGLRLCPCGRHPTVAGQQDQQCRDRQFARQLCGDQFDAVASGASAARQRGGIEGLYGSDFRGARRARCALRRRRGQGADRRRRQDDGRPVVARPAFAVCGCDQQCRQVQPRRTEGRHYRTRQPLRQCAGAGRGDVESDRRLQFALQGSARLSRWRERRGRQRRRGRHSGLRC